MSKFGFGIVGTGMIANVIADAISKSNSARLVSVSSRKLETAQKFVQNRGAVEPVVGFDNLLLRNDVQAVYIATPTSAKEEIALAALEAGKHILLDKPFMSYDSIKRITDLAQSRDLVCMDATHFVHHPRTAMIKSAIREKIGTPKSLHTAFYFPFTERNNIRFDVNQEPTGAIGDMAWYSMRAVVEYLMPEGKVTSVMTVPEYCDRTNAVVRASGVIAFEGSQVSTFDVGYTSGALLMDLQLLGTTGAIGMDDFVLDWAKSWSFQSEKSKTGYTYRTGLGTRADMEFVPTASDVPQEVLLIENFSKLAVSGTKSQKSEYMLASLRTQEYLDALWKAIGAKIPVHS